MYSAEPLFSRALDWIFWAYSKPLQYSTMQEVIQLNCRPAGLAFSNFCSTSLSSEKTLQEHKDASILASQALTGRLRWLWSQLSSQSPLHLRTLMSCQWRQIKLTQTHFKRRMPNPQRQEVHTFTHKKTHTHTVSRSLSLSLCLSLSCCLCVSSTHSCWQLSSALPLLLFLQYCCACNNKQTTQRQYVARFEASIGKILCLSICACSTRCLPVLFSQVDRGLAPKSSKAPQSGSEGDATQDFGVHLRSRSCCYFGAVLLLCQGSTATQRLVWEFRVGGNFKLMTEQSRTLGNFRALARRSSVSATVMITVCSWPSVYVGFWRNETWFVAVCRSSEQSSLGVVVVCCCYQLIAIGFLPRWS